MLVLSPQLYKIYFQNMSQVIELQQKLVWAFNNGLECLQELCGIRSVHNPVVSCDVDLHHLLHTKETIRSGNYCGFAATNCHDACCACTAITKTRTMSVGRVNDACWKWWDHWGYRLYIEQQHDHGSLRLASACQCGLRFKVQNDQLR